MTENKTVWRVVVAGLTLLGLLMAGPLQFAHAGWSYDGADTQTITGSSNRWSYNNGERIIAFTSDNLSIRDRTNLVGAYAYNGSAPSAPYEDSQASGIEGDQQIAYFWSYGASGTVNDLNEFSISADWSTSGEASAAFYGDAGGMCAVSVDGFHPSGGGGTVSLGRQKDDLIPSFNESGSVQTTLNRIEGGSSASMSTATWATSGSVKCSVLPSVFTFNRSA